MGPIRKMPMMDWFIKKTPRLDGHEYVDMGNGVMWATMNVGATSTSVTDPGELLTWQDAKTEVAAWGENWRLPTNEELQSLFDYCKWTLDETNKGMIVTSTNGNSIFLPFAGYFSSNPEIGVSEFGSTGLHWSSTLDFDSAVAGMLSFYSGGDDTYVSNSIRCEGLTIRPVFAQINDH